MVSAELVAKRDTPPKKSSKGKRPGNPFPRQSNKKRRPGDQGFEDPSSPTPPIIIEPDIEGDKGIHSVVTQLGATPTTPRGADDVEGVEPAKGSATRKVQHPVYFIISVLRDARERYPMMQKLLLAILIDSRKMRPHFVIWGGPIFSVSCGGDDDNG